jgi:hypothetical protein
VRVARRVCKESRTKFEEAVAKDPKKLWCLVFDPVSASVRPASCSTNLPVAFM